MHDHNRMENHMNRISSISQTIVDAIPALRDNREYLTYVTQAATALGSREGAIAGNLCELVAQQFGGQVSDDQVLALLNRARAEYVAPTPTPAQPSVDTDSLRRAGERISTAAQAILDAVNQAARSLR